MPSHLIMLSRPTWQHTTTAPALRYNIAHTYTTLPAEEHATSIHTITTWFHCTITSPFRHHTITPSHQHTTVPPSHHHTITPSHHHSIASSHHHTITSPQHCIAAAASYHHRIILITSTTVTHLRAFLAAVASQGCTRVTRQIRANDSHTSG